MTEGIKTIFNITQESYGLIIRINIFTDKIIYIHNIDGNSKCSFWLSLDSPCI